LDVRSARRSQVSIAVRRQTLAPQTVLPPHSHAAPMLAVVLRGAAELRLPGRAFGLGAAGQVPRTAAWLRRVDELLDARFLEPLRLEDVARVAGLHPMHVARTFRAAHGESIAASLRRRRVLWAAERLAAGREPLSAIALAAGFCDQAHFCRIFRKVTGRTPGSVRRRI
jgi:AraC family transcriptional regulator